MAAGASERGLPARSFALIEMRAGSPRSKSRKPPPMSLRDLFVLVVVVVCVPWAGGSVMSSLVISDLGAPPGAPR